MSEMTSEDKIRDVIRLLDRLHLKGKLKRSQSVQIFDLIAGLECERDELRKKLDTTETERGA